MKTPFNIECLVPDLPLPDEVAPYIDEMAAVRWYSNFGPLNQRFEAEICQFLTKKKLSDKTPKALTCSSATAGLELALRALDLPRGGKVLVPALTFPASALAILNAGLEPVLCDVDIDTWMLEPEIAEASLDSETVAVMPVTTYGRPLSVGKWEAFSREKEIPVIVDAAASLGQQAISENLIFVFSLHATKPFGVGEGGLVVGFSQELVDKMRSLSNFGFKGLAGIIQSLGLNAKMGEYYAGVGLAQIKRWPQVFEKRQRVWQAYQSELARFKGTVRLQSDASAFVPGTLMVRSSGLGQVAYERFTANSIQTRRWYLPALYRHPALKSYAEDEGCYPVCETLTNDLVGLPFHGFMDNKAVESVCTVLADVLELS